MSVERIALDIKVEIQGLVEALEGKGHAHTCRCAGIAQQCNSSTQAQALTCTAHVLPAILIE